MRFQAANSADLEAYSLRLELLAKDCAHLAVPLLRAACDRVAAVARGLPYASEILTAAREIIEDRQRVRQSDTQHHARPMAGGGTPDGKASAARRYNIDNTATGNPMRWTDNMDIFRIGETGERRATREDGSVIEPWFGDDKQWRTPKGDEGAWSRAHEAHDTHYALRGGVIVDTRAA